MKIIKICYFVYKINSNFEDLFHQLIQSILHDLFQSFSYYQKFETKFVS